MSMVTRQYSDDDAVTNCIGEYRMVCFGAAAAGAAVGH